MKKAVIYVKVNGSQNEAEKQLEELWAFAEKKGFEVANAYYEISGSQAHVHGRTIWDMLYSATNNEFDTVIVKYDNQLANATNDEAVVINTLNELNINFVSLSDELEPVV